MPPESKAGDESAELPPIAVARKAHGLTCGLDSHLILKHMLNQSAALDLMFQALADPSRRVMVERLTRGPASVSELAKPLAMSLPAVVQHLQVLEASGLVRSEKAGRVRTCHIEPRALRAAEQWIADRRTLWERRLDRLGTLLAADADEPGKGGT
jgi:DNA-binding transcriptional ArsR family regulator